MTFKLRRRSLATLLLVATLLWSTLFSVPAAHADPTPEMNGPYNTPTLSELPSNNLSWPADAMKISFVDRGNLTVNLLKDAATHVSGSQPSSKTLGDLFGGTYKLSFRIYTKGESGPAAPYLIPLYCKDGGQTDFPEYQTRPNAPNDAYTSYEPSVPCIYFGSNSDIAKILMRGLPWGRVQEGDLPSQWGRGGSDTSRALFAPVGAIGSWFGGDDPCGAARDPRYNGWFKNVGIVNKGGIQWNCGNRSQGPCDQINTIGCDDHRFDSVIIQLGNNLDTGTLNNFNKTLAANEDGTALVSLVPRIEDSKAFLSFNWCQTLNKYVLSTVGCDSNQVGNTPSIEGKQPADFLGDPNTTIDVQVKVPGGAGFTATVEKGQPGAAATPPAGGGSSSDPGCQGGAFGWVLCPAIEAVNNATNTVAKWLDDLLVVRPLTDPIISGSWDGMRNIANVAFVVAFLIVIFSQATSVGLTNYGIKRLLPRVIAAAILVNISFFVCQLAVDLSNLVGNAVGGLIAGLAKIDVGGLGSAAGQQVTQLTDTSLSGGARILTTVGIIVIVLLFTVPVLLMIVVIWFILAFRQALIILLTIVAPLAFVAWLLPNTQRAFNLWLETFAQMLFMYPAIMALFAACTTAARILAQGGP